VEPAAPVIVTIYEPAGVPPVLPPPPPPPLPLDDEPQPASRTIAAIGRKHRRPKTHLRGRNLILANVIARGSNNTAYIGKSLFFGGTVRAALVAVVVTVNVEVVPGTIDVVLNEQPSSSLDGTEQVSDTELLNPFCGVTEMV
jgi:hypothetical protein